MGAFTAPYCGDLYKLYHMHSTQRPIGYVGSTEKGRELATESSKAADVKIRIATAIFNYDYSHLKSSSAARVER